MHFSLLRLAPSHPIISGLWEAYNPFKTYSSARRPLLRFAPSHPIVSGLWETYNPFKTHCDSIYWGLLRRILLFQDSERLTTRSKDLQRFHLLRFTPSHPIVSGLWETYNPFKRPTVIPFTEASSVASYCFRTLRGLQPVQKELLTYRAFVNY